MKFSNFGQIHLFGEMDLNLKLKPKAIYKKACDISECCGYLTTIEKGIEGKSRDRIEIFGEDCDDRLKVINILYFQGENIDKVQKCVYKLGYEGKGDTFKSFKQLTQVYDFVNNEFIETFNAKRLKITMPKEYDLF